MSIFRKASESEAVRPLPNVVANAFFDTASVSFEDEFAGLLKEASSDRSIYENRLKEFNKVASKSHEFEAPQPAKYNNDKYSDMPGGIRRAGYGQRFQDEQSELFSSDRVRNPQFDNNKYAESMLNNGLSIWDAEFDDLQNAFEQSQKMHDSAFDRKTAAEKKASAHKKWESSQIGKIREAKVLPYRGLGVSRLANEQPVRHGDFGSVNDFYADAQDSIREMSREASKNRKAKISRKGVDPAEARSQWENKESIAARTMKSLEQSSLLARFAEGISLDDK
jgi:hypothetical protein